MLSTKDQDLDAASDDGAAGPEGMRALGWRLSAIMPEDSWYSWWWYAAVLMALANAGLEPTKLAFFNAENFS